MRYLPLIAVSSFTLLLATGASAQRNVTAAQMALACSLKRQTCVDAVKWVEDNTSACVRANLKQDDVVDQVIGWLKANPNRIGQDKNEIVSLAIGELWPCR